MGLLRKRAFPTTEFGGDGVVDVLRAKKAKRSPEPTTAATSKSIKTMYKVLRCLTGCTKMLVGVFAPGLRNESLPGLLPASAVEGVCLSFADGVNVEGDKPAEEGEKGNEDGGKDVGAIPSGQEGCNGL